MSHPWPSKEVRPSFVTFLISFVVVAIAWTGHRDLFALIRLTDRRIVWLNLLYMLPLTLLLSARPSSPATTEFAILVAGSMPVLSMWIYAGAPILYFTTLIFSRATAPPGATERDFT